MEHHCLEPLTAWGCPGSSAEGRAGERSQLPQTGSPAELGTLSSLAPFPLNFDKDGGRTLSGVETRTSLAWLSFLLGVRILEQMDPALEHLSSLMPCGLA